MKYILLILGILTLNIYFFRWTISYKFIPDYWENFYYESQWNVPNSSRQIGDGGVYLYIGYRLANGENPFNVDYWVPPFGKHFYGLSAKYLSNPFITSIIFFLAFCYIFFLLSKELLTKKQQCLAMVIFVLNPFIVSEIGTTMLDVPLALLLTTSLLLFIRYIKTSKNFYFYSSIVLIGLAACTKPPYFIFAYIAGYSLYLLQSKQFKKILLLPILAFIGYVLGYVPTYFLHHPNPIPWLRLHQKIFDFQKNNLGSSNWLSVFTYLLYGRFMGYWVGAKPIYPTDYSLVFTLGSLSTITNFFIKFRNRLLHSPLGVISLIGTIYIVMLFFIDFWPRYLIPIIPIFSIIILHVFSDKLFSKIAYPVLFISLIYSYTNTVIFPPKQKFVDEFRVYQEASRYKDMYQLLDSSSKNNINPSDFIENKPTTFFPIKENNLWRMSTSSKINY